MTAFSSSPPAGQATIHPPLVRAVIAALADIFFSQRQSDKVLEHLFRRNRRFGSHDRKFIAETVYDMVRWWGKLARWDGGGLAPQGEKGLARRWCFYEQWKHGRDVAPVLRAKLQEWADAVSPEENPASIITDSPLEPWDDAALTEWLYRRFEAQYGSAATTLLAALNEPAPLTLRANRLKTTREGLAKRLAQEGYATAGHRDLEDALVVEGRRDVFRSRAFHDGWFEVQDAASQRVALFIGPCSGERVADVCAGAGGKTLHLAALMANRGTLLAADVSKPRLEELSRRARRAGVSNLRVEQWRFSRDAKRHQEKFDAVLIDAPCSGTGVIRRNPDTKWKLSERELDRLRTLQIDLINRYAKLVRPGGRLVYATCSLLREENEGVVAGFLASRDDFVLSAPPLVRRPDLHGEDGFFAAKLFRIPEEGKSQAARPAAAPDAHAH